MEESNEIVKLVNRHWNTSNDNERDALIKLMTTFESPEWSKYMFKAEKNDIIGSEQLMQHYDDIMDSSARGIADHDGTIKINFDKNYYQEKLSALTDYIAAYLDNTK